jgi:hypothetical protein
VVLLVSDDCARIGRGSDAPLRLFRALVVALFEDGRTERVERVGGRILVVFLLEYTEPDGCRERLCRVEDEKKKKSRCQLLQLYHVLLPAASFIYTLSGLFQPYLWRGRQVMRGQNNGDTESDQSRMYFRPWTRYLTSSITLALDVT